MTSIFTDINAAKQDDVRTDTGADLGTTTSVGDHAQHHNDLATAANILKIGWQRGFINAEQPPFNAVPDAYFIDGVATNASTTFTSATASFVSGDAGKNIMIVGAGASRHQDHHTTIASVTNSTTVVLTNAAQRSQTACPFYISRSGNQQTAIQAALDECEARGGGTVLCPGVGYLITGLKLGHRVWLSGAGMRATVFHQDANSNQPVVQNRKTPNGDAAMFCAVLDCWVDGNATRQGAHPSTTIATTSYTVGATTLQLTDSSAFLPSGAVYIGRSGTDTSGATYTPGTAYNRGQYFFNGVNPDQTTATNKLTSVTMGQELTTDVTAATGTAVWAPVSHGIYFAGNPAVPPSGSTYFRENYDPHFFINRVLIKNTKGEGVCQFGQSESYWDQLWCMYAQEVGYRPAFDSFLSNCNSDNNFRIGYLFRSVMFVATNLTSFYSGVGTAAEGYGYVFEGPTTLEEGGRLAYGLVAQDNKAGGFMLRNCQRVSLMGGIASSNSVSSSGTYAGVTMDGATNCFVDVHSTERVDDGSGNAANQKNALSMLATSLTPANNRVRLTHAGTNGLVMGTAIKSGSALSGGNSIEINGQGSYKVATFASSYTPDPYEAMVHEMTLTGNVTINAPANAHLGTRLRFRLIQDATGGRTMTFNAALPATWGPTLAASSENIIEFEYNGSAWKQISPDTSAPISKRLLADVTNSTTTVAAMTDLDFTVAANTDYTAEYYLMYSSAATTTGIGLQVGVSGSTPASIAYDVAITGLANTDGAGSASTGIAGDTYYGLGTAIDDLVLSTGVVATSTIYLAKVTCVFRTGGTGGTCSIKQRSEVASSTVTFKRGSHAVLWTS